MKALGTIYLQWPFQITASQFSLMINAYPVNSFTFTDMAVQPLQLYLHFPEHDLIHHQLDKIRNYHLLPETYPSRARYLHQVVLMWRFHPPCFDWPVFVGDCIILVRSLPNRWFQHFWAHQLLYRTCLKGKTMCNFYASYYNTESHRLERSR